MLLHPMLRAAGRLHGPRLLALGICSAAGVAASEAPVADTVAGGSQAPPTARDFSFSGCGFLIPYHLGVAQGLQEAGYIQKSSRFAGASGGAIAALTLAADANVNEIQTEAKNMAALCHTHGTLWKLEERLRAIFHKRFSDLAVDQLGDRLTIATEKLWPQRDSVLADTFESPADLCDALIASCYIPWYLAPRGSSLFRGEYHVDGGIVSLVPEVAGFVKVCAFHAHLLNRSDYEISPSMDPDFPYGIMQLARFALVPPDEDTMDELFELGKRGAAIWAKKQAAVDMENALGKTPSATKQVVEESVASDNKVVP